MLNVETIKQLIAEKLTGTPHFLVDIKVNAGNKVLLVFDSDTSFNIDDCVAMNRFFEANFSRDIEDYELEVSSAGLTSAFKQIRQYKKYIGKKVQVIKKDGIKYSGILKRVTENEIAVEIKKSNKKEVETSEISILMSDIKEAKPFLDFK